MAKDTTPRDFWNNRYDKADYHFGKEPNAFLAAQAHHLIAGQKALAIADGEGRNGVYLAQQGLQVHSVDFSPLALQKAQNLAHERGVQIDTQEVDIFNYPFGDAVYDAVVAIFIQFAPPEKRAGLFEKFIRALKPGGLLILQGYRPEQVDYGTGGPPQRENMYTEDLLRQSFADLEIILLESYDQEVDEGPGHSGRSALIGMVARKP
jgi:SAM-dependent methyltransferase